MRQKTKEHLDKIMDTFSGADGGVSFLKFKMLIEGLDTQAQNGDRKADMILDIMRDFSKLIDVAQIRK